MGWLSSILGLLKGVLGFGEKIAANKALKIPMKEVSIRSEAEKDKVKDEIRIEHLTDKEAIRKWFAYIKTLHLSIRKRKKLNKTVKNMIISKQEVTELVIDGLTH